MLCPFRASIAADPSDDAPALIYADWIEEQGDPDRAAVLRRFVAAGLPRDGAGLHRLFTYLDEGVPFGPTPFVRDDNPLGMAFCWCPPTGPGGFLMGSPEDEKGRWADEDQVTVRLTRGFWLGKAPITQRQWQALMSAPSRPLIYGEGPDHPIYYVSHDEAEEFCARLQRAGPAPPGWCYRLPTEAQWEYACRAGTKTVNPFGDHLTSHQANFNGTEPYASTEQGPYLQMTTPVGSYPANAWGFLDMIGNVWEWCRDVYQPELIGGRDPLAIGHNETRICRGASWYHMGLFCRSAERHQYSAVTHQHDLGLRVALVEGP